jgi:hypothetical protein
MSEYDATDIEMMIVFNLVEKGFSMSNAKGLITLIKRSAWTEGYESGRDASYDYRETMNPYG